MKKEKILEIGFKLLFVILSFFVLNKLHAQNPPQKVGANYQFQSHGADSSDRLPKQKAFNRNFRDTGMVYYNRSDKKIHWTYDSINDTTFVPTSPSSPNLSIQFNKNSSFSGDATLLFDTINKTLFQSNNVIGIGARNGQNLSTMRLSGSQFGLFSWPTRQGDTAITAPYGNFLMGIDQSFANPDGQNDASLSYCYNCSGPGIAANPHEIEWDRTMESHFDQAGTYQFEVYDQAVFPNENRYRPWAYYWPLNGSNATWIDHFDSHIYNSEDGSVTNFSYSKAGQFKFFGSFPNSSISLTADSANGYNWVVLPRPDTLLGITYGGTSPRGRNLPHTFSGPVTASGSLNVNQWARITSGSSYTAGQDTTNILVNPASALSSLTITLPGFARDGMIVDIYFGGSITPGSTVVSSFTLSPNVGFAQSLFYSPSPPSAPISGSHISVKYDFTNSRWYKND